MMIACAVYDAKAAAFDPPIFVATVALAIRSFSDACLKSGSFLSQHPEDYTLHQLASYDPNSGKFENLSQPKWLAAASQVVARASADRLVREPVLPGIVRDALGEPVADLRAQLAAGEVIKK